LWSWSIHARSPGLSHSRPGRQSWKSRTNGYFSLLDTWTCGWLCIYLSQYTSGHYTKTRCLIQPSRNTSKLYICWHDKVTCSDDASTSRIVQFYPSHSDWFRYRNLQRKRVNGLQFCPSSAQRYSTPPGRKARTTHLGDPNTKTNDSNRDGTSTSRTIVSMHDLVVQELAAWRGNHKLCAWFDPRRKVKDQGQWDKRVCSTNVRDYYLPCLWVLPGTNWRAKINVLYSSVRFRSDVCINSDQLKALITIRMCWSIGKLKVVRSKDLHGQWIVTLWPLITVSNKVNLQNQLQNLRASDPEESNEVFDRAIRRWLL